MPRVYEHGDLPHHEAASKSWPTCKVCYHKERGWIEHLTASGASLKHLSIQFGLSEEVLRFHDQLHSVIQPSVDPVSLIREMRYLMELTEKVSEKIVRSTGAARVQNLNKWKAELEAIRTRLQVVNSYADLTNAKKYIQPHISLPRWQQVVKRITGALEGHPDALRKLYNIFKEEGPEGGNTYGMVKPLNRDERVLGTIIAAPDGAVEEAVEKAGEGVHHEEESLPYFRCCDEWQAANACQHCGKEFAVIVADALKSPGDGKANSDAVLNFQSSKAEAKQLASAKPPVQIGSDRRELTQEEDELWRKAEEPFLRDEEVIKEVMDKKT